MTLLDGVTGSGKTEVYFEAVADAIRARPAEPDPAAGDRAHRAVPRPLRRALRRAPGRMALRAVAAPARAHLAGGRRRRSVASSSARARRCSCLTPISASSSSMRSTTPPTSRRTASATTPATWRWCAATSPASRWCCRRRRPRSRPKSMPGAAATGGWRCPSASAASGCPAVEAIDLRRERPPPGRFIAPTLAGAVQTAIERGEQALFFLNRRGYAPLTLVPRLRLPLFLPELRRLAGRSPLPPAAGLPPLRLRHAASGRHARIARRPNSFVAIGPGVERLEEEVRALFPQARAPGPLQRSRRHGRAAARGARRRRRRAASTSSSARSSSPRAIISPSSTSSASSTPISGLSNGDPRAAERTFQLLHQVVGRAGRDAGIGRGYLQTHQPEHPVMRALIAQDREAFYAAEIAMRERSAYPPFGRLASLVVSGPDRHDDAKLCAAVRPRGAASGRRARARPRRRAAVARARPPSPAPVGQSAARLRSLGLFARVARRRAKGEG